MLNLPARGYFLEGETVRFSIVVRNTGTADILSLAVSDQLTGAVINPGTGYQLRGESEALIELLPVGGSVAIHVSYTVSGEDARRGYVTNVASAYGTDQYGNDLPGASTEVTVPANDETFRVTVHYVYLEDGTTAAPDVTQDGLYPGETYTFTSPAISGYTASAAVVSGTMPAHDVEVTVFYVPRGQTIHEVGKRGIPADTGHVVMTVGDCFD